MDVFVGEGALCDRLGKDWVGAGHAGTDNECRKLGLV